MRVLNKNIKRKQKNKNYKKTTKRNYVKNKKIGQRQKEMKKRQKMEEIEKRKNTLMIQNQKRIEIKKTMMKALMIWRMKLINFSNLQQMKKCIFWKKKISIIIEKL